MRHTLHGSIQRLTSNMTWSKLCNCFSKDIGGGVKSLNYFRNGVQMMFGFVGKECSPIFAQRVTRTYKAFQLHSKLWSNFTKVNNYPSPKKLILGFVVTTLCKPQFDVISYEELLSYKNDLDYIHDLTTATVVCPDCKDRLVISKKIPNIKYCHCPNTEPVYNKKVEGFPWTPFVETPDLIIWRQPHPKHEGLFTYKVYGYYDDISPMDFLATQLDLEYRKKWDNLTVVLKVVDTDAESSTDVVHWEMKWPKMFSNRDYCFVRRHLVDEKEKTIIIMNKAIQHPSCPAVKGVVRVTDYWSVMQIVPVKGIQENGVEFGLTYFDNPGLSLPQWLTNWAAIAGIPEFLNKVRLAARATKGSVPGSSAISESVKETGHEKPKHPKHQAKKGNLKKEKLLAEDDGTAKKDADISTPTICSKAKGPPAVAAVTEGESAAKIVFSVHRKYYPPRQATGEKNSGKLNLSDEAGVAVSVESIATSSSSPPGSSVNTSERGEILSQFFKQNFLSAPSS